MMQRKANEATKLEEEGAAEAEETADLSEDAELPLALAAGGVLRGPIAKLENVAFRYPGMEADLFAKVDMSLDSESRVCLLGENGDGKTTLVKVMLGHLDPTQGTGGGAQTPYTRASRRGIPGMNKAPGAQRLQSVPQMGVREP
jgi:ATPase subunit of ABC transporter with duplicated ATPase domains